MTKLNKLSIPALFLIAFFGVLTPITHATTYSIKEIKATSGGGPCGSSGTALSFTGYPDGQNASTYPSGFTSAPTKYCFQTTTTGAYGCELSIQPVSGQSCYIYDSNSIESYGWYQYSGTYIAIQGSAGTDPQTHNWSFAPAQPTATLAASSTSIGVGNSTKLTWTSAYGLSCTGTGFSTGSGSPTNGQVTVSPSCTLGPNGTCSVSYSVNCTNNSGSKSASVSITVSAPTVTLAASPTSITTGDSSQLSWSVRNFSGNPTKTTCTGTNFSTGNASSGNASVSPATTTTYSISCTNSVSHDTASATRTVTVTPVPPPAPTVSLTATPPSITAGNSSTLAWSSTDATSCTGSGFSTANKTRGSVSVSPTATTGYSVTCDGAGGSAFQSATVTVTKPPPEAGPGPSCTLNLSPTAIDLGESSSLTWSCDAGFTRCDPVGNPPPFSTGGATSNGGSPPVSVSPSETGSISYGISCTGPGLDATAYASVLVETPNVSITASPTRVRQGSPATLTWLASDVAHCSITDSAGATVAEGDADGNGIFSTGSPRTVTPDSQTTYTFFCDTGGTPPTLTSSATVNVTPVFTPF